LAVKDFEFIAIRGFGGAPTSTGIDTLAKKLKAMGLKGRVINQELAVKKGLEVLKSKTTKKIVFGYSMGATDAIDLARALITRGDQVPLVFTMDPHLMRDQVDGVTRHINVWQDRNLLLIKPFFPVKEVPEATGFLENIHATEIDSHGDIDDTPWVQERFLFEVESLVSSPGTDVVAAPSEDLLPPWIEDVNRHIGLHEKSDNRALSKYLQSDGTTLGDPSKHPWCGDLVETAIKNTLPNEQIPNNPYWARNWANFGVETEPRLYCLLVFTRGNGGHVGFMVGETDKYYIVRGGNQSNRITDSKYAKSRLIAARWPLTYDGQLVSSRTRISNEPRELEAFHKVFFDHVRKPLFAGRMGQSQVDGMKSTLAEWFKRPDLTDHRWLAYMLATAWLETDRTMQAISEYGDRAYFTRRYDIKGSRPDKARELGNIYAGDGAKYHGRGKPMLTGRANYQKADKYVGNSLGISFEEKPSQVLIGNNSDLIMFSGMIKGWYTGKKLSDYFNDHADDPIGARRIVNGQDRAGEIAEVHETFLSAIRKGYSARDRVLTTAPVSQQPTSSSTAEILANPSSGKLSEMTNAALLQVAGQALLALSERAEAEPQMFSLNEVRSIRKKVSQSMPGQHDGKVLKLGPTSKTQTGVNLMGILNGQKSYIVALAAMAVGITEGLIGFDLPGVQLEENWLQLVLGGAGFGAAAHKLEKLLNALLN